MLITPSTTDNRFPTITPTQTLGSKNYYARNKRCDISNVILPNTPGKLPSGTRNILLEQIPTG
jgi:hypothetical protein